MKQLYLIPLSFILYFLSPINSLAQKWNPPVPVLTNSSIKDLAKVSFNDSLNSFVIEYNPELALEVGPFVSAYFQAHEYGHIHREHVGKKKLSKAGSDMLQLSKNMEIGADRYAVETLYAQDKSIILAMIDYLQNSQKEDLQLLPRDERLKFIQTLVANLDAQDDYFTVSCKHYEHNYHKYPCMHFTQDGKTSHVDDKLPCFHVLHPQGDKVYRSSKK